MDAQIARMEEAEGAAQAAEDKKPPSPTPRPAFDWAKWKQQEYATTPPPRTPTPTATPAPAPQASRPWWQKALNWVDQHQTEIAIGIGIVAGVTAIILTAGTATPFVVAAGGAMLAAGGIVGAGTIGLNAYYGRPLGENLLKNVTIAAGAALVTVGVGTLFTGGATTLGNSIAGYCTLNPTACARVGAVLTLWDKVEDIGLQAKLALQTAVGDPRAAETALELQLERLVSQENFPPLIFQAGTATLLP